MSGYAVEFDPDAVNAMLAVDGLSTAALLTVLAAVQAELGRDADRFLRLNVVAHESYRFRYDYPHQDAVADCQYNFEFVCDGRAMPYGVVTVISATCEVIPFGPPA